MKVIDMHTIIGSIQYMPMQPHERLALFQAFIEMDDDIVEVRFDKKNDPHYFAETLRKSIKLYRFNLKVRQRGNHVYLLKKGRFMNGNSN